MDHEEKAREIVLANYTGDHELDMSWVATALRDSYRAGVIEGARRKSCEWSDDDDGIWSTSCGNAFIWTDGDAKENDARYCLYCGGKLVQLDPASVAESGEQEPKEEK